MTTYNATSKATIKKITGLVSKHVVRPHEVSRSFSLDDFVRIHCLFWLWLTKSGDNSVHTIFTINILFDTGISVLYSRYFYVPT